LVEGPLRAQTRWVPSRAQLVAFCLALLFLAGSLGYGLGTRSSQSQEDGGSEAEVGFLVDMIAHHEQAVTMSKVALSAGMPEGVASFALEVVSDQRYEIGVMEALLQRWGRSVEGLASAPAMAWMGSAVDRDAMPGMASEADLSRLSEARGEEAAALWLAMMTTHHEGGVHMASAGASRIEDRYLRDLAARMARVQAVEIKDYSAARARLGLPAPTGLTPVPVPAGDADADADGGHGH
jgi:uncharacterized protein (DUF305 family)